MMVMDADLEAVGPQPLAEFDGILVGAFGDEVE